MCSHHEVVVLDYAPTQPRSDDELVAGFYALL